MSTPSLSDIQQSFVRKYMTDDRVLGVRVRSCDGGWILDVEVDDARKDTLELPEQHLGIPVRVRPGSPAVLAYAVSP
jgi:hypothetical protein